jgi:hypothetical protein
MGTFGGERTRYRRLKGAALNCVVPDTARKTTSHCAAGNSMNTQKRRALPLSAQSLTVALQLLVVVGAMALWAVSLPLVDPNRMNDLGLLSVLPLPFYGALGVLTVSFCVAVHRQTTPMPVLLIHVVALILIIHATPAIVYGTIRYAWTWKHVGIIDYIQRHGSVDPSISFLDAYHNWPGFFALGALFTQVAGFKSAISFAAWGPPFFNLIDLGVMLLCFKTFTRDARLIWLGAWFFYLTNWVGQDYFSPQAFAYFLHLTILGICLTWFGMSASSRASTTKRRPIFDFAAKAYHAITFNRPARVLSRFASVTPPFEPRCTAQKPLQRAGLLTIVILLFAVIVSSHQLTPFMTILSVAGLVICQRCRARNLPILLLVMTVAWIINMAVDFLGGNLPWVVRSIGQLNGNTSSTLINVNTVSHGLQTVAFVDRIFTLSVYGLACLGFIRRVRGGHWDLSCMMLTIAPLFMLGASSYGGEMLFRVYFFSLPFMAFFAAALLYPSLMRGTTWRTVVMTVLLSSALLVGLGYSYYGKERMNYFSKKEVAAAEYLYNIAPRGSLLLDVDDDTPNVFQNYEWYDYDNLLLQSTTGLSIAHDQQLALLRDPAATVAQRMEAKKYPRAYLIITKSQKADSDENGYLPAGSLSKIERVLKQSKAFKVVYSNSDATIFVLSQTR